MVSLKNRFNLNINIILFLGLLLFAFYWVFVRPSQIKARCYKNANSEVYQTRQNENNFDWAPGKRWMPKPGHSVTDPETYVWIYSDQSDTTWEGEKAFVQRKEEASLLYENCLKGHGLSY